MCHLKFIYSEKATKFCEIFPLLLNVCTAVTSKGKISQNFVAFSEYMNFTNPQADTRRKVSNSGGQAVIKRCFDETCFAFNSTKTWGSGGTVCWIGFNADISREKKATPKATSWWNCREYLPQTVPSHPPPPFFRTQWGRKVVPPVPLFSPALTCSLT